MQKQLILGAVLLLACLAARADVENQNEIDSLLLQWESTMDQSLDEVVVTGQGSAVSKRRLSSNITKLSASDLEHLHEHWQSCRIFPMACNVQMVFFQSATHPDDVLVKVLLNEREATLPVTTDCAPYYHWNDVRNYFLNKLSNIPVIPQAIN